MLRVKLFVGGVETATAKEEFDVTHRQSIARPWVHSRVLPARDNPVFSHILGVELFNLGRLDEASAYLEKANAQKKGDPEIVAALGQIYLTRAEYDKIIPLVDLLIDQAKPAAYEIYYLRQPGLSGDRSVRQGRSGPRQGRHPLRHQYQPAECPGRMLLGSRAAATRPWPPGGNLSSSTPTSRISNAGSKRRAARIECSAKPEAQSPGMDTRRSG